MVDTKVILEHIVESVVITDPSGHICFFNPVANSYANQEKVPIKNGVAVQELCSDENKYVLNYAIEIARETGESQAVEVPLKRKGQHNTYLEVVVEPILNGEGQTSWLCIAATDITRQKMWERKAAELGRALSELTENANAVIFSVDSRFYVTAWNGICAHLTGFHQDDVLAKPLRHLIHDNDISETKSVLEDVLMGNIRSIEFRIHAVSGEEKIFLLNATPRRNSEGEVVGILFVGQDITELSDYRTKLELKVQQRTHQLKEALLKEQQLLALKDKFIAIASHEFRTPLRAIAAHVRSISSAHGLSSDHHGRLAQIEKQVAHMNDLLEDILTFEKGELPQLEKSLQGVELIELLDGIIQEVRTAGAYTHRIDRKYQASRLSMLSDEKLLRNIFINLITNALKFTPAEEIVRISVAQQRETITVSIEDNGIGIPPEDQHRIFDAFTRASNALSIPGTGLGLPIVKRACDALGADLKLVSDPGKGTKVYVQFVRESM